ncbi:MAG: hypothetical protein AABM67_18110 [Acidobacteriota bacterium]
MNADGGAALRLANTLENDDSPAWASDGTKITFAVSVKESAVILSHRFGL